MSKFLRRLKSRSGTSLVELIVAMLILGIVLNMIVGILSPAAKLFLRMEKLQRAQIILDNTIEELYALTETASGYVKLYGTDNVVEEEGADKGSMLEFIGQEGYVELVSANGCEPTRIMVGGIEKEKAGAVAAGRLLVRYYHMLEDSGGSTSLYQYKDASGSPIARAVSNVFMDRYYMGNYLELAFSFPAGVNDGDAVTSLNASVRLYDTDSSGNKGTLLVQEENIVLDFRYAVVRKDAVTAEAESP